MRASTSIESTSIDGSPRFDFDGEPVAPTMSPRCISSSPVFSTWQSSCTRPERSTRSRNTSFPMSRRPSTRPATRRVTDACSPFASGSDSARTDAISTRSRKCFGALIRASLRSPQSRSGSPAKREAFRAPPLGGLDVHDLERHLAARRCDLDRLALLAAHDRLADRRLVRQLVLGRVRLGRADDVVLDGFVRLHVAQAHLRPDRDLAGLDLLLRDDAGVRHPLLEHGDARLEMGLFVLRGVVLGVLGDVAELTRDADPVGDLATPIVRQVLDLVLELLEALGRENDFLQLVLLRPRGKRNGRWQAPPGGAGWYRPPGMPVNSGRATIFRSMQPSLRDSWWLREVEIPTRVVLAPMAGVSVQAFRRQGRRYGAGLVCSEMVSCAGIEHRNERTLGYLRVGADEHPLAIQIFGSEPDVMAEAARMVEAAGADIVDMNFGCPVRKVTKTGAGAHLLEEPDLACRITEAVASAVTVPVTVKMRRGLENGSRACLEVGPLLARAGAATLTLHPRSAKQMYTGTADHSLTAELVSLVDVPVIASGDVTSRARAQAVLATTGAAAVMVGRAAQGNPWALREIMGDDTEPTRDEVVAELLLFIRETVRELGEHRATGFLKKFYGWYLGRGRFPKPFKQELLLLPTIEEVETRLLAAAPGAREVLERLEAELPEVDEVELDSLPISLYGGG